MSDLHPSRLYLAEQEEITGTFKSSDWDKSLSGGEIGWVSAAEQPKYTLIQAADIHSVSIRRKGQSGLLV